MKHFKEDFLRFYRKMLEIRVCDDHLTRLKLKDLVMDGFHPYNGQEAVAVGVCESITKSDYMVSTHRPQGHAIAKGIPMKSIFCEMLGRVGGPSDGIGGPMQWIDAGNNFFCSSIVGSGVCIATGFGLSLKKKGSTDVCVCFFGDGATNTGAFHEGMNLAAIWKLPILFICENNQYGEAMPVKEFIPVERISSRAASYGMKSATVDGMNVSETADLIGREIKNIREGAGPIFVEAVTYRYRGHFIGDPEYYRSKKEVELWRKKDPIEQCRTILKDEWKVTQETLAEIETDVKKTCSEDQEWALQQPKPTLEYAVSNVLVPTEGSDNRWTRGK